MTTISEPAVRHAARDGRQQLRRAELRRAELRRGEPGQQAPVVSVKLRIPQPSVPVLQRPRVTELVRQAAAAHRVVLVTGPGGAGKTVACALWAATAPASDRVAWLSLDHGDREPASLWASVRSALAGLPAVPDDVAQSLPDPGDEAFGRHLAEVTQRLDTPVTLVLDDICRLAGAAALSGLDQLIRQAPPALRLVLTGRHPAGLQVARLRVGGDLAEIGGSDLACTADEAAAYFAMLGLDLPAAQRDELQRRTQGWMAGLRLAAMRTEPGSPGAAVAPITGDEPPVADYLRDEVLAGLPAERRLFLLRTSVTDAICGELADALTEQADGDATLDRMCRENMMVGPAAAAGRTDADGGPEYRYHPLLLDLLRAQLRRELPDEVTALHRRAARWQAGHGRSAEAIRSAARAGDWDFAARILADIGPMMLLPDQAAGLEPVLAAFPASRFTSDAPVAGALAAAGLRTGDSCAAALHLANAISALDRCPAAQRRSVEPWLHALRLMNADPREAGRCDLAARGRAVAERAEATALGEADRLGLGLLWCALGVGALTSADTEQARACFGHAARHLRDCPYRAFGRRARAWLALADAMGGDPSAALALNDSGSGPDEDDSGDGKDGSDRPTALVASLAAAHAHWARDESAAALRAIGQCDPDEPAGGAPRCAGQLGPAAVTLLRTLITVTRARLALSDGDQATARTLLSRLRYQYLNADAGQRLASGHAQAGIGALDAVLAPLDAEIALRDGDPSRARLVLARASSAADPGDDRPERPGLRLCQARLLLAQDDNAGALRAAEACLAGQGGTVTLHDHVSALVTAAIARRKLGRAEQATENLTCALAMAEPLGMVRPFLDGGPAARSVLTVLIRPASQVAAFAARVLRRFDAATAAPAGQPAEARLTSSELAVLRLLPSHMTNQEIAEALFLSINTVKTHLRSVYRKLGVTTRRQAISRGSRLGLL